MVVEREVVLGHVWGHNLLHYREHREVSALWFSCLISWDAAEGSAFITPKRSLHIGVYHRVLSGWTDKENRRLTVTHNRTRLDSAEWSHDICSKVGGTGPPYIKWNKPISQKQEDEHSLFSFIYWGSKKSHPEHGTVISRVLVLVGWKWIQTELG